MIQSGPCGFYATSPPPQKKIYVNIHVYIGKQESKVKFKHCTLYSVYCDINFNNK